MNNISALAFDLDGTLYNGRNVIEEAVDTIAALEDLKYKIFYFTNNSTKTRQQLVDKLNRLGFAARLQNTYSASYAILEYLLEKRFKNIYLIGSRDLRDELSEHNIKISNSSRVSAVIVGLDASFDYGKIAVALEAIDKGAKLIVANLDSSYPVENNRRLPGCGAMVGAITAATSHLPDFTAGKPNTYMLELLCREHKLSAAEICIVGDSLESDIKMARNLKCPSILFDPKNKFPEFCGKRIRRHREIISLIHKKRGCK